MSKIAIDWLASLSVVLVAVMAVPHTSFAEERDDVPAFKLTVGGHHFSESGNAIDVNLRHSSVQGTTWLGYFDSSGLDAHQFRGGWEHSFGDTIRFLPSIQAASGGFVGGSINLETGNTWFIGAGFGRTNLRPYFNLNYDPNDAWSLSGGYRAAEGVSYAVSYTRDNRENPDQQHFHMVYKTPINDRDRATFDVLFKRGLVNGDTINKVGVTATYDWPRFFVRLAYDPNTNFTPDNVVRVSIGSRF
jgi:hypothetical protein